MYLVLYSMDNGGIGRVYWLGDGFTQVFIFDYTLKKSNILKTSSHIKWKEIKVVRRVTIGDGSILKI